MKVMAQNHDRMKYLTQISVNARLCCLTFSLGTIYFRAQDEDGILLMSAFCVYCCASPLFLSSVLMAHLNKALNVGRLNNLILVRKRPSRFIFSLDVFDIFYPSSPQDALHTYDLEMARFFYRAPCITVVEPSSAKS